MSNLKPQIVTGLPATTKEAGQRVDFKPDKFDLLITTKGHRVWWSRAAPCPCRNNPQTEQPDPTCDLCDGDGELLFLPEMGLETAETDKHGNPIEISDDRLSVGIDALMSGLTRDPQIFERFGAWVFGTVAVSTQAGNELGWRDRLEMRDTTINWMQLVKADGAGVIKIGTRLERLRYRALSVTLLRSLTTVFRQPGDYSINGLGQVEWANAAVTPAEGTILTVHYKVHPVYRVLDHPHAIRDTKVRIKARAADKAAQHRMLPTQCMAKLDFLADSEN